MAFAEQRLLRPVIGRSLDLTDFRNALELGELGGAGGKIFLDADSSSQV